METIFIIAGASIALIIYYYNKLIKKKNEVDNATGSINTMLKNRFDLIPNLIEIVKNYMQYETDVLNKLTTLRTKALDNHISNEDRLKLNTDITRTINNVMLSVENYPDLKANTNFIQLQESWTDIEDRISASRRFYNNAVTDYNNAIKTFPGNIFSKIMQYKPQPIFEVSKEESTNLNAKVLFDN